MEEAVQKSVEFPTESSQMVSNTDGGLQESSIEFDGDVIEKEPFPAVKPYPTNRPTNGT